jgi:hypothetical protein
MNNPVFPKWMCLEPLQAWMAADCNSMAPRVYRADDSSHFLACGSISWFLSMLRFPSAVNWPDVGKRMFEKLSGCASLRLSNREAKRLRSMNLTVSGNVMHGEQDDSHLHRSPFVCAHPWRCETNDVRFERSA